MSYEGRVEYLCEVGHRWTEPCDYSMDEDSHSCPVCQKNSMWSHSIDDTNVDAVGFIPDMEWDKLLISPEKREVCNLGHSHVTTHATYRVPTDEEKSLMEHTWNSELGRYIKLFDC